MSDNDSSTTAPARQPVLSTAQGTSTIVFPALPAGTPAELIKLSHDNQNPLKHFAREYAFAAFARGITEDAREELKRRCENDGYTMGIYDGKLEALNEQKREQKRVKAAAYVKRDIERRHARKATRGEWVEAA